MYKLFFFKKKIELTIIKSDMTYLLSAYIVELDSIVPQILTKLYRSIRNLIYNTLQEHQELAMEESYYVVIGSVRATRMQIFNIDENSENLFLQR